MRIAVSVLGNLEDDNGTTVRAKRILNLMSGANEVSIISRGDEKEATTSHLVVSPPSTKLWNFKLIPLIRRNRFDLIYCSSDFFGFISYYYFAPKGTKIIMETHGIKSLEYLKGHQTGHRTGMKVRLQYSLFRRLERFVVRRADHVIALSQQIERYYRQFNDHIDTIPVFLDDSVFKGSSIQRPWSDEKLLGVIGPFEKGNINNHFLDFIKANIDRMDPRISIRVIGKIDEEMKIQNPRVTYSGYLESIQNYVGELDRLDGVLVPSVAESYGALNKILEPMALGKLVYTTPLGYVGLEDIPRGEAIFVSEEEEMLSLVERTIFDKALTDNVGKKAIEVIAESYSRSKNKAKIQGIIERL